jgi:flavin-dependent dehydrogenase
LTLPVLVIGGGPAGTICARQLARLGHSVTLAERTASPKPNLGETCSPRVRRLLEHECDLSIPPPIYRPLSSFFSAWNSAKMDGRSFTFWQADEGFVLNRRSFDRWLLESAESSGVSILRGCNVTGGKRNREGWTVNGLIDGQQQTFKASFVVEAIGSRMRSAIHPDVKRLFTDRLVCLSVELKGLFNAAHALVESCEAGWWYTVQLPDGKQIVSLFTDSDMLEASPTRADWLNSALKTITHMRHHIGEFARDADVHICDARTSIRNVLWRSEWVSIGDAARSLDPLSGTGIQRAIEDGLNAAHAISRFLTSGSSDELRNYAVSQAESFKKSLTTQRLYYGSETRWRSAPFWRRRL